MTSVPRKARAPRAKVVMASRLARCPFFSGFASLSMGRIIGFKCENKVKTEPVDIKVYSVRRGDMIRSFWDWLEIFLRRLILYRRGNRLQRYGLPVVLTGVVLVLTFFWPGLVGHMVLPLLFMVVIVLCAWFGGFGPGIWATVFTGTMILLTTYTSGQTLDGEGFFGGVLYLVLGFSISVISESLKLAQQQREDFISLVSHEIKNPLTVIKAYASFVRQKAQFKRDPELNSYAVKIDTQVSLVVNLVDELLSVGRLGSGQLTFHDEPFCLFELVREVVTEQNDLLRSGRVRLSGQSKRIVVADRHRVGQVLMNLINNAIKYSPQDSAIGVKVADIRGGIMVTVRDNGLGIERKDQEKIFRRFFRSEQAARSSVPGLGVGLYISQQIVKKYHGDIQVKSALGKGSVFSVVLPVR